MLNILMLGAGIQSSTILLMSEAGDLPRLDGAIFSDTQWESRRTYKHLDWLKKQVSIPLHVVSAGNLREHTIQGMTGGKKEEGEIYASIPLRTLRPDGSQGMIRRQCTKEYKINPIDKFIKRELLGLRKYETMSAGMVGKWFGISSDEAKRVRIARNAWERNIYPLLNMPEQFLEHPFSRVDCEEWLLERFPDYRIPRSSCLGCPYHSRAEWRSVREDSIEWEETIAVDRAIRNNNKIGAQCFLFRDCIPLEEADIDSAEDKGQMIFDFLESECLGYCGN